MSSFNPTKGVPAGPRKGSSLIPRNIRVGGHRTSIRFEPYFWDCLEEIARRERLSVHQICTMVAYRLKLIGLPSLEGDALDAIREDVDLHLFDDQSASDGPVPRFQGTLTSAIRLFILAYFVRAATRDGHTTAGHGKGDLESEIEEIFSDTAASQPWAGLPSQSAARPPGAAVQPGTDGG